jgi:precorrin-6Y C5,15-methyltransferase (decarboxylating)
VTGKVTVIGIDGRALPDEAGRTLAAATLVVGGARHLETLAPPHAERVVLGDVAAGLAALDAHDGPAVVLASGDPGFFGIARLLADRGIATYVIPAVGSVATLCARAGVNWDDAAVISAHGRGPQGFRRAVNACRALPKVVVLTAPGFGPAELGAALAGRNVRFVVGERLGTPDERVTTCCPSDAAARGWAEPNVVLMLADGQVLTGGRAKHPPGWAFPGRPNPLSWALDEDAFEHRDGMVTKAEIRAVALSRLGPGVGDLIWDVGAGSGSVAIECARFGAAARAVERDAAQCERVANNAKRYGVAVDVVHGSAPEALAELPDPDAVFVGGGGAAVTEIVAAAVARAPRAVVVALAALERVAPTTEALREAKYRTGGVQLTAARLTALGADATRLAALNPVIVLWGQR